MYDDKEEYKIKETFYFGLVLDMKIFRIYIYIFFFMLKRKHEWWELEDWVKIISGMKSLRKETESVDRKAKSVQEEVLFWVRTIREWGWVLA